MYLSEMGIYAALVVVIIYAIRKPFVGLVAYYVLSFWRPQDIYWYALGQSRLSYYVALTTVLSAFLHGGLKEQTLQRTRNLFFMFFVVFFLLMANSYLFSRNPDTSWIWFILLAKILFMAMMTILIVSNIQQVRVLLIMVVICFGILAIRGNFQYFFEGYWKIEPPGPAEFVGRLDNNGFGMQFVMAIPICFFLFFTERKYFFLRWGILALVPFLIHAIILTYSRGAFVGMSIVLGCCVFFLKNRKWAILAAIVLFAVVVRLQGQESEKRLSTVSEYEEDPSVQSRFRAWKAGRIMILDNPITGVGVGNFAPHSQEYNPELEYPLQAHNAFFQIGGEMGLGALLAYIGVIFYAFLRLWKISRFYRPWIRASPHFYYCMALGVSLVGFVICGMFLSLNYLELFYFMIALVGILNNIYRDDLRRARVLAHSNSH